MQIHEAATAAQATREAATLLATWLSRPDTRALMVAGGNSPLPLYAELAARLRGGESQPALVACVRERLQVFVLDEYVGVPPQEPRSCTQLLRRCVQQAWGVRPEHFFGLSSREEEALERLRDHERRVEEGGGLDAIVLGLGVNGHLGFNEPGSGRASPARLVELESVSIEANRAWFGGDFAPRVGATVGLRTILAARRVLLLAFGAAKAAAVRALLEQPAGAHCPASFLREHAEAHLFADAAALREGATP